MSRAKGDYAETLTCKYLESLGFVIVERNFYSRFGEIDIIAQKDGVYRFIEVKSGGDFEAAIQNITPQKVAKLVKTIDIYLKKRALTCNYQLDAAIVVGNSVELIESITM